jgi:hypothetical protein
MESSSSYPPWKSLDSYLLWSAALPAFWLARDASLFGHLAAWDRYIQ